MFGLSKDGPFHPFGGAVDMVVVGWVLAVDMVVVGWVLGVKFNNGDHIDGNSFFFWPKQDFDA